MAGKPSKKTGKVGKKAAAKPAKPRKTVKPPKKASAGKVAEPVLLSGGNPQIAKGYGDAPVQAFIAAMPGWKSDVGRRLDALIERTVPGVGRPSNGTRRFTGWRTISGSSASMSSRNT